MSHKFRPRLQTLQHSPLESLCGALVVFTRALEFFLVFQKILGVLKMSEISVMIVMALGIVEIRASSRPLCILLFNCAARSKEHCRTHVQTENTEVNRPIRMLERIDSEARDVHDGPHLFYTDGGSLSERKGT